MLKALSDLHNMELIIFDPVKDNLTNQIYSSSFVKDLIKMGQIEKANKMLGYLWTMDGKVIHGDKRAREINFPTANIYYLMILFIL